MRKRARTDLCGGRSAMVVPTATSYVMFARDPISAHNPAECAGKYARNASFFSYDGRTGVSWPAKKRPDTALLPTRGFGMIHTQSFRSGQQCSHQY
jgi:hypothetical protein